MTAMLTYRTAASFGERFGRERRGLNGSAAFEAEHYLRYQGQKLVDRFDAGCYAMLTRMMDTHDVGRGRGGVEAALAGITQPALVVGVDTDLLYPLDEQCALAEALPNADLAVVTSPHGHDAFLIEFDQLAEHLAPFVEKVTASRCAT
jgi:homoserine O-acetyltransferase